MVNPLPKWIMHKYAKLWRAFSSKNFSYEQAVKVLKETAQVSTVLSDLRKSGWMTTSLDPKDNRRRIYSLISPEEAVMQL